jgi:hypothetical protein
MPSTLPSRPPGTLQDRVAALEAQLDQVLGQFRDYLASREGSRPALTLIPGGKR